MHPKRRARPLGRAAPRPVLTAGWNATNLPYGWSEVGGAPTFADPQNEPLTCECAGTDQNPAFCFTVTQ